MFSRERAPFPRRMFRSQWRTWLASTWKRLLVVSLPFAGTAVIFTLVLRGYLLGLVHGLIVGVFVLSVVLAFFAHTRSVGQMAGAWGEEFTRGELRRARRKGLIWGTVHGLAVASGDIDHLVVTRRGGLVAIDSKWRNDPDRGTLSRDAELALAAARRASLVLRSFKGPTRVRPVIAVWGASRRGVPPAAQIKGVDFIDGGQLLVWLKSLPLDPIDRSSARQLLGNLRQFERRVRPMSTAGGRQ